MVSGLAARMGALMGLTSSTAEEDKEEEEERRSYDADSESGVFHAYR